MTIAPSSREILAVLALIVACLVGCSLNSSPSEPPVPLPQSYPLADVRISVTRYPGNGPSPVTRVILSGTGEAQLERGNATLPYAQNQDALMAVLNELYRIRFFEMPSSFTKRFSVFLKDEITVVRSAMNLSDAASTSICVNLGNYEKCVSFPSDGPTELRALAQRIFDHAEAAQPKADGP